MIALKSRDRQWYIVVLLVAGFSLFALLLRLLPMFGMGNADILSMVASDDPLYNLRQVEQILAHFPAYAWFDPMTQYPVGSNIYWGPLFPTIGAFFCLLLGAATRPAIIGVALVIPPLMAAATVALMYPIGKSFGDWKTGLVASGFTAVVSGQFFFRSLYGYYDHHIAEVLFSTLFCLLYVAAILRNKGTKIDLRDIAGYRELLLLSVAAGIGYLLGLFTMPTMILFAMIVGIFTIIQFIIDVRRGKPVEYLLIVNTVVFATAIIGLLIFGIKSPGIDLSTYSIGHIYAYLLLIAGTAALWLLAGYCRGREKYLYPASLAGLGLLGIAILFVVSPPFFSLFVTSLVAFFGQQPITNTVIEAIGWTPQEAWDSFSYGLILFAGGAIVMIYNNAKDEHPHQVFALVWSLVMFYSTWQHVRYEYYLAVNIALLAAVFLVFVLGRGWKDLRALLPSAGPSHTGEVAEKETPRGKKQKKSAKKGASTAATDYSIAGASVLVIALAILFVYSSLSNSSAVAASGGLRMNPDWRETMDWMGNNTPDTGVNYLTIYDQKTFSYPPQSYGVMSWWDYGHLITYIAKRIPNANPFQAGVSGPNGSAAFFMATSEDTANRILDNDGTRYIVTDYEMDTGKFPAMATWYNSTLAASPYMQTLLAPSQSDPTRAQPVQLYTPLYFPTMISRLHNFDGSLTTPTTAYLVEYNDPGTSGPALPVITDAVALNVSDAKAQAAQFNSNAPAGSHARVLSVLIWSPIDPVPALRQYRLVHESPTNIVPLFFNQDTPDIRYVKTFEYVRGAHIKGTGIIEVPVVTDTGRNFTYRQESVNGEFVVPYSTSGNPYGVHTTGKYRIAGTGREYDVPESAVMQGLTIG